MQTLPSSSPLLFSSINSSNFILITPWNYFYQREPMTSTFQLQKSSVLILFDLWTTFAEVDCSLLLEIPPSLGFYNIILFIFPLLTWLLLLNLICWMFFSLLLLNVWGSGTQVSDKFSIYIHSLWDVFLLLVLNINCMLINFKCISLVKDGFQTHLSSWLLDALTLCI